MRGDRRGDVGLDAPTASVWSARGPAWGSGPSELHPGAERTFEREVELARSGARCRTRASRRACSRCGARRRAGHRRRRRHPIAVAAWTSRRPRLDGRASPGRAPRRRRAGARSSTRLSPCTATSKHRTRAAAALPAAAPPWSSSSTTCGRSAPAGGDRGGLGGGLAARASPARCARASTAVRVQSPTRLRPACTSGLDRSSRRRAARDVGARQEQPARLAGAGAVGVGPPPACADRAPSTVEIAPLELGEARLSRRGRGRDRVGQRVGAVAAACRCPRCSRLRAATRARDAHRPRRRRVERPRLASRL